jgi:hypothetical protein
MSSAVEMAGQFEGGGTNQHLGHEVQLRVCCKAMRPSGSMPERIVDKVEGSMNSLHFSVWKAVPAIGL